MADMKLPCFQFRLRTLLIAVTLLCMAFAFWMPALRESQESIAFATARGNFVKAHPGYSFEFVPKEEQWVFTKDRRRVRLEGRFSVVALPLDASNKAREQTSILFPEARVVAINPKYKTPLPPVWPNPPVEWRGKWYEPAPIELQRFIPFPDETH
jgi:hypothetical protein